MLQVLEREKHKKRFHKRLTGISPINITENIFNIIKKNYEIDKGEKKNVTNF